MVDRQPVQCRVYPLDNFQPCEQEELAEIKNALAEEFPRPQPYQRGTLTEDRRLDLCKQNLGTGGLRYLLPELVSNRFVETLLEPVVKTRFN